MPLRLLFLVFYPNISTLHYPRPGGSMAAYLLWHDQHITILNLQFEGPPE